jgi:hypothetical protein
MNWRNVRRIKTVNNVINVNQLIQAFQELDKALLDIKTKEGYKKFSKFEIKFGYNEYYEHLDIVYDIELEE